MEKIKKGTRVTLKSNGKTYVLQHDSYKCSPLDCDKYADKWVVQAQPINGKTGLPWQAPRVFTLDEVIVQD